MSSSISSEYDDVLEVEDSNNTSYNAIINDILPYANVYDRRNHKYFENTYNTINDLLAKIISHCTTLNNKSDSTLSSTGEGNQKDNSFVNSNIKSLNKMDQQHQDSKNTNNNILKCQREAEEACRSRNVKTTQSIRIDINNRTIRNRSSRTSSRNKEQQ